MALEQCFMIFKDNIRQNISSGISVVIIAMLLSFLLTEIGSVEFFFLIKHDSFCDSVRF